jgi:hypothetical protein
VDEDAGGTREVHGEAYGDHLYVDGAVYWPTRARLGDVIHRQDKRLVRFDLATEEITSEEVTVCLRLRCPGTIHEKAVLCGLVESAPCLITYGWGFEWDAWFPQAEEGGAGCLPRGCARIVDRLGRQWNVSSHDGKGP